MTGFFEAFWPNLTATMLGVVLGLPIALYLNRRLLEHQGRLRAAEAHQRLNDAIDVLVGACQYNIGVLDKIKELAVSARVMRNPDLRVTTWDAVGAILSKNCNEPDMLQLLSHHWLRLHRLEQLNQEIFAREVGSLPPIADQELALGMWQELHDNALTLSAHAKETAERLANVRLKYAVIAGA
jgi:hypothetical protein